MEIIYADSLFFLNFLIDYLLCLVSARVCGLWLKRKRYVLAALVGAAYSVAVFLPGMAFLSARWGKLGCAGLMGAIAYGSERRRLRCTAVFMAVSAAFGGAVWALSMAGGMEWNERAYLPVSSRALLLAFALCWGGAELLFRARGRLPDKPRAAVTLTFLGKECSFMALLDSGNSLTDPVSGAEVMVVSPHALLPVLGSAVSVFTVATAVEQVEALNAIPELRGKFRLIPYSALGTKGLLPAFRPDKLTVDGIEAEEKLAAVSPSAAGDGFDAII